MTAGGGWLYKRSAISFRQRTVRDKRGHVTTKHKLTWVAILYFAEGFPYGILNNALPVFFRIHGMSLAKIGLLNVIGLPWMLKFLWAPALDQWGQRRSWVVACQALLSVGMLMIVNLNPSDLTTQLWATLVIVAVLSATQDIAIDAYTIDLLDPSEMGPANGVRVTAYRVALIASGGVLLALADVVGWASAFVGAALLMAASTVLSSRMPAVLRPAQSVQKGRSPLQTLWEPFRQFFAIPGFGAVAFFVLTFKLADDAILPMTRPFWVDRHFTPLQIGAVPGTLGAISTIFGAMVGGILTRRWGVFRALFILGIAQAGSSLFYAAAAALPPSIPIMYVAAVIELFCAGLGTAPFLSFLMSICDKKHSATQYAVLSALFVPPRILMASLSGIGVETLGYAPYFILTFFLGWPALCLIPRVRKWSLQRYAQLTPST